MTIKPNPHKGRSLLGAILLVFGPLIFVFWYLMSPPLSVRTEQARQRNEILARTYVLCVDNWKAGDSICTLSQEPVPSD